MGVDRLIMTFTGRNIRETILFPLLRPGGVLNPRPTTARGASGPGRHYVVSRE